MKPPTEYAGVPLPEVRVVTNRLLNAETTEKVLNGLEKIENIRQVNVSGESLPAKINSGPNKGLDNNHPQRRIINVSGREVELRCQVGYFFIELEVEDEEALDAAVEKIKAVCDEHIEHGFSIDLGRYSKYRTSLNDYKGV
ncbi:MAG: methyl-coenzyme M reductase operon protein D [Candidatus Methanomethylophilaceae archaeon]